MAYERRRQCEANIYHVIVRGEGRMLLFEDRADREMFLDLMRRQRKARSVEIVAWCLMGNHAHLLLRGQLADISSFMEGVERPYVRHYNRKYDHVGHLFQGRFKSVPIEGEPQLLETVRYIHRNPVEGGLTRDCDYEWSSYREYLGAAGLCSTSLVMELVGGREELRRFHVGGCDREKMSPRSLDRCRLTESEVSQLLSALLGECGLVAIPKDDKVVRDSILANMKSRGASIRQIERVTGIGRNIIAKARKRN